MIRSRDLRFRTQFAETIAKHWEKNHPDFWARFSAGNDDAYALARFADECADKAAEYFSTALTKGVPAETAYDLAEKAWKIPHDRYTASRRRAQSEQVPAQKVSTR